ncbi:MAG: DNA mismatch repair endonuclease MutL [Proteobacteria bacterium]|nr:DNA mismatch repair endonuclease MutL [Pseudomonadota bacterium]
MAIRILSDSMINQIAAGEVIERPASVVKELVENSLDAGADQIVIDVADGGRTLINIVDNGRGMGREDLGRAVLRHATSKLPDDNLLNIRTMGFRGEALPSIAGVSDMTIDTCPRAETRDMKPESGYRLDCTTGEIKPSAWEGGTRVRVENLFGKTPARLKFLRSDRAEMMSVVETVKRLALSRPDVGFVLNQKWRYPKGQPLAERIVAVMGDDVAGRMLGLSIGAEDSNSALKLTGFISEPTLRRASGIDQYLFVNGRPVKDKVLVGALRAAYLDVMSAREFPAVALYLELPPNEVDVNVSPAKTEVHFLEPARVRGFIIKSIRSALAKPLAQSPSLVGASAKPAGWEHRGGWDTHPVNRFAVATPPQEGNCPCVREPVRNYDFANGLSGPNPINPDAARQSPDMDLPLGRPVAQIGNKYILAERSDGLVIVDQHAAHERITYERLRTHEIRRQPLLVPIVVKLKPEEVAAVAEVADELSACGLTAEPFGDDAIVIQEKPADWDMDWAAVLRGIAQEVMVHGHSSRLAEKLHLRLANYACHHSVRAGQRLDYNQMDALLRDTEKTERGGECNHGRPAYRIIPYSELDGWFERS